MTRSSRPRRTQRGSAWLSTLFLEAIAVLAIIGVGHPVWFQSFVQRLTRNNTVLNNSALNSVQPIAPIERAITEFSDDPRLIEHNVYNYHPMEAFQQPFIAPAHYPSHPNQSARQLPPAPIY
jgi:hypothetical protein